MKKWFICLALALCLTLPCTALASKLYLIDDSNTRQLTREELWEWDYESLGYILNEIFARHGYNFEAGGKYDYYFRCMPWYVPNEDSNNQRACYSQLTTVEWKNEQLVKEVRAEMRELNDYNSGGKSVWDQFSAGFDTLQGFEFVTMQAGQKLDVYSAPMKSAWRGADGKALVSSNESVYAAGWESGWLLVMYETYTGGVRVGYVCGEDIRGKVSDVGMLNFDYLDASVTRRCTLTDDPIRTGSLITILMPGDQVTYLSTFFSDTPWDYVETVVDGQLARGFIPSGYLNIAQVAEAAERTE